MRVFRPFLIKFTSLICIVFVGLLVYTAMLHLTVLDRTSVKGWLQEGGLYENKVFPTLINPDANVSQTTEVNNQYGVPLSALQQALERTFTKTYVQQQTETTVDRFYDWIDGTSPTFTASIPIHEKKDTFIAEFTRAATPHIAALPVCKTPVTLPCRPSWVSPELYTQALVTSTVAQSTFFEKPLELNSVPEQSSPTFQTISLIQTITPYRVPIMIALACIAIISAILHIWLIPALQHIRALSHLGRRLFFSQIITFILAFVIWWLFQSNIVSVPIQQTFQQPVIVQTLQDIVKLSIADISMALALLSGTVAVLSLALWLGMRSYSRRKTRVTIAPDAT